MSGPPQHLAIDGPATPSGTERKNHATSAAESEHFRGANTL